MTRLYANNFSTTLDGAIDNSQTSIDVTSASGLPAVGGGDTCLLTIDDGTNIEIVQVTGVSSNTLTVVRGREGTSGTAFDNLTPIQLRATANSYIDREGTVTFTGTFDAGGAVSIEIPNSAAPTVNADGEIALDTTVADFSHGIIKYYGGEEMAIVAMPVAELSSPTDGHVVAYNATSDEFELVAGSGGPATEVQTSTSFTFSSDGEIGVDTSVADFSHGVLQYYGAETLGVVAMPIAEFTTPTDGHVIAYNATNDEFELVAPTAGSGIGNVVEDPSPQLGGDLDVNGNDIVSVSNGDIVITPDGTGNIILDGLEWPGTDGSNGHVLTTNGAGVLSFQAAAGGGGPGSWTLLDTQTASNSATISFTSGIDSTYPIYIIVGLNIVPASNQVRLQLRTSSNGGSSYDSTAGDYSYSITGRVSSSSMDTGDSAATEISLNLSTAGTGAGNDTGESYNFIMHIFDPSNTSYQTLLKATVVYAAASISDAGIGEVAAIRKSVADVDALQFFCSSGNIASGVFRLYGMSLT